MEHIHTLSELRQSGWTYKTVKEELADNLARRIRDNEPLFPGIIGYDDTVIPELENALLSGHDMIILGERGQAKSRIIRGLTGLLDEYIPVIEGCEISDNPFSPLCRECKLKAIELGDRLPISWLHREERYGEKLATPDISVAELIGDVDPIKVAEGRYLSDERIIHFGLMPRLNRGIFAINELPDLPERVQLCLFNLLEERDIQIKGFKIRLPLDMVILATANPEDYTHRGRIISPLKDRYSAQIRTHYPEKRESEIAIVEQENRVRIEPGKKLSVPRFIKEIIAGITFEARKSPEINQRSGVSVRMSITNYESVTASAAKRAIRLGEGEVVPRISDLPAALASSRGKIELEYAGEERTETEVVDLLIHRAVKNVFDTYYRVEELQEVIEVFNKGAVMEVSPEMAAEEYADLYKHVPGLMELVKRLDIERTPAQLASAAELILEGLHLSQKLNKQQLAGRVQYKGGPQPRKTVPRKGFPSRGEGDEGMFL